MLGTAMVAAAVLSCKKDEIKQETLEVSPSKDLQFLAKGNEDAVLTISTNASSYEVDAEEWVITQKDGNKLSVNVTDNESAERSCDMTISAGTAEPVVIKITQAAGEADAISVAPTPLLFRASGNEPQTLTVTTNVEDWTYDLTFGENEEKGWFTVTPDDADPKSLTVTVKDYTETDGERTGSIDFSAGKAKVSVPVRQSARDMVEVTPSEPLTFSWNDAEGVALEVTTTADSWDVAVDADADAQSWITTDKENATLTISVSPNDSESSRSGKVTVSAGNAEPVEIQVTQTGKPAPVNGQLADKTSTDDPVRVAMEQGATAYTVTPVLKLASALEDAGSMTLYYDEQVLNNWNEFGGSPQCTKLPEGSYTLPEEGFTIPAGQTDVQLPIEINLENLEYETSYMLVLKVQAKSDNIGDVSCGNDGLRYIITTAKEPAKPVDKTRKNLAILEVNDVNPLSVLEVKFTDGTPFFDGVVLFSSNIQYNADGNYVELYHNPNVQTLLEQRDTYIKPLQDAGIEVYLSILGNHTPAWVSNLLPATAELFAAQVANAVKEYHLDGVFLDDEYRGTYSAGEYEDLFYPYSTYYGNLEPQYSQFGYILKQALKTLSWNPKVILYQVNEEEWRQVGGTPVNEYLDLLIPDHNGTRAQYFGPSNMDIAKENMAYISWNCRTYGFGNAANTNLPGINNSAVSGSLEYGNWVGWYNLNLDPTSGDGYFNWMNNTVRMMQFYAYYAFDGAEIATPTGYYEKTNPGQGDGLYNSERQEYDGFYSGSDWRDYLPASE